MIDRFEPPSKHFQHSRLSEQADAALLEYVPPTAGSLAARDSSSHASLQQPIIGPSRFNFLDVQRRSVPIYVLMCILHTPEHAWPSKHASKPVRYRTNYCRLHMQQQGHMTMRLSGILSQLPHPIAPVSSVQRSTAYYPNSGKTAYPRNFQKRGRYSPIPHKLPPRRPSPIKLHAEPMGVADKEAQNSLFEVDL